MAAGGPAGGSRRGGGAGSTTPTRGAPPARIPSLSFLSFRPGPEGPSSLTAPLELELLKAGYRRAVYRTSIGGFPAIVKLSFHPLGRFKLALERRRLEAMGRRGLPAPRVLGSGRTRPGRWALVSEELAGGVGFDEAWLAARTPAARRALLLALSDSVRALHRAGVEHRDPHAQNLLVTPRGAAWVDAAALRLGLHRRPLSPRRARRNLAAIYAALAGAARASPREWLRALRQYLGPDCPRRERRRWARTVLARGGRLQQRVLRRRGRRCLETNREFLQVRRRGLRGAVRREALGPSWERFLVEPESLFQGAEVLKDGRSTRAARILWNGRTAFLKRYHRPGFLHRLKYVLRPQRALRSWTTAYALELRDVAAPRALCAVELRRWGWPTGSYLVTEWAEGVTSDRVLTGARSAETERRTLAEGLARELARAHARGVWHRDLKPQNVFFAGGEKVLLVDFDGARLRSGLSPRRRERDLGRWLRDLPAGERLCELFRTSYHEHWRRESRTFHSCLGSRFA